jgi:hypothetical protein
MKKIILFIALMLPFVAFSQNNTVQGKTIRAKKAFLGGASSTPDTLIKPSGFTGEWQFQSMADPIDETDGANKRYVDALVQGLNLAEVTDPATNEATSTAIIDTAQGVIVTLTTTGNDQTLQQPTDKRRRRYTIINNSTSTNDLIVLFDGGNQTKIIRPGSFNTFLYDSLEWSGNNITSQFTLNLGSTAWNEGGEITGIGSTTFNVSAGKGVIIDNATDPSRPKIDRIEWSAFSNVTISFPGAIRVYIGLLRSAGVPTLVQQTTPFTAGQLRDIIRLGSVARADGVTISSVENTPVVGFNKTLIGFDIALQLGNINAGNVFKGLNGTANIEKTSGSTLRAGRNALVDSLSPNITSDPAINPATFVYAYQDGSDGLTFQSPTTNINGANYDDGTGVLATTPSNDFTNQKVYYFPSPSNLVFILYGQNVYNTFAEAKSAAQTEVFNLPVGVDEGASKRAIITLRSNFSTFTDPVTDNTIYNILTLNNLGETGVSSGGSTGQNMQGTYDLSMQPQIVTSSGLNAVQFQNGTGDDNNTTQEWKNNAGDVKASVDGNGNVIGNKATFNDSVFLASNLNINDNASIDPSGNGQFNSVDPNVLDNSVARVFGGVLTEGSITDDGSSVEILGSNLTVSDPSPLFILKDTDTSVETLFQGGAAGGGFLFNADATNVGSSPYIGFRISGSDKIRVLDNGNTGFGTINPPHRVSVSGNLSITGINKKLIIEGSTGSNTEFASMWVGSTLALFQYPDSKKFGIQAATSQADVGALQYSMMSFGSSRNTMFADMPASQTDPGERVRIKGATNDNTKAALNITDSSNSSLLYVRNDGKSGFNTETPLYTAHINGDLGVVNDALFNDNAIIDDTTKTAYLQVSTGAATDYFLTAKDANGLVEWSSKGSASSKLINDAGTGAGDLWSASKIQQSINDSLSNVAYTNKSNTFTADQTINGNIKADAFTSDVQALSGTTPTLDITSGKNATTTLTGNTTLTLSNVPTGMDDGTIEVTQDATTPYSFTISGATLTGTNSEVDQTLSSVTTVVYWKIGTVVRYGFIYDN